MICVECYQPNKIFAKGRKVCKDCRAIYHKQWRAANAKHYSEYHRNYQKDREDYDPTYKIQRYIRKRLSNALFNNQKVGSAIKDLGCTIEELKLYLESKFQFGMTWDNYGLHGWHIDHIQPISKFNLSNIEEFKQACHYTNLQPLWAKDNLIKNNK